MTGSPAPDAVLQLMSCTCLRVCKLPSCQCLVHGIPCTDACRLQTCDNMKSEDNDLEIDDDDDDDDD